MTAAAAEITQRRMAAGDCVQSLEVMLVDPGLMTAPYDAALSSGLVANGVNPCWVTRRLRVDEDDALGNAARPMFYPITDGPRRRGGKLWRKAKGLEHLFGLRALERLASAAKPDIVHFQWAMLPQFDLAAIRRLRRQCPVVVTVHDVKPFNGKAVHPLQRAGVEQLWQAADRLIVHTESGRRSVIAAGNDADRVTVVPHGVLGKAAVPRVRESGDRWHIVQFGRIQAYKGVDVLVEALGRLDPVTRSRLTVTIAGEAQIDLASVRQRATTLGLDATLTFRLHRHSQDEMDALLATADTFVFPYRVIDASGVLFEIAPLGRWIVASRLGSFAELLGDERGGMAGTLVPPDDAAALADALAGSIGRTPHYTLSDAVPDWAVIGARTRAVYAEAIAAWHHPAAGRA